MEQRQYLEAELAKDYQLLEELEEELRCEDTPNRRRKLDIRIKTLKLRTKNRHLELELLPVAANIQSFNLDFQTQQRRLKVDRNKLVGYDLRSQMFEFQERLKHKGASVFSIGGEHSVLESYLIQRILQELKTRTERPHNRLDLQLFPEDILPITQAVERKLLTRYKCQQITDLFADQSGINIVLIVWNSRIPLQEMRAVAEPFWQKIKQQISPFIDNQKRCFIIIWANINMAPLDGFNPIETPNKFELDELEDWFCNLLRQLLIKETMIKDLFDRIKGCHGYVHDTHREIDRIFYELQEGVISDG